MIRVLREIKDFIMPPLGQPQPALKESLASNWVAMKMGVMRGEIDPAAPIYVGDLQPGRGSGYMTVQSLLKTVEDGWGYWDHKAVAWWCQVLKRANDDLTGGP